MIGLPFAFTVGALRVPRPEDLPLWAFLFLVVAFDVAHVWSTLYVSYLDRGAFARRRLLFLLPVPITVFVAYRLHLHSPVLFWTLVAYVAIHHFAAQQYGFVALYKLRAGERDPIDRYLDKWTLWVGALGPVLWWHASPAETRFDWFGHGEQFLFRLDPALRTDVLALMAAFAVIYGARQVRLALAGRFNVGKNLWMLGSWLSWSLGIGLADHPLVSLACINLFHGIPFLVLVWHRCNQNWEASPRADAVPSRLVAWLSRRRNVWAFYGLLLVVALAEEGLWEGLVWGTYLPRVELGPEAISLGVALLATPQIVHYYLDAWLWKLDGSNPDLEHALGLPPRA